MDPEHKKILNRNRLQLVRDVIVNEELLSVLRGGNIITEDHQEMIESKPTSQGKVAHLLDILPRRGKRAFAQFITALKETSQDHLVSLLIGQTEYEPMQVDDPDSVNDWMKNMDELTRKIEEPGPDKKEPGVMNIKVKSMNEDCKTRLRQQSDVYQIRPGVRTLALIINIEHFDSFSKREGSEYDVKNLKNLFEQLNCEVITKDDLKAADIKVEMNSARDKLAAGDYDAFIYAIMSHGHRGIVYGRDGHSLNIYSDILSCFNDSQCPKMLGKPKLFFIQACQGGKRSTGVQEVSRSVNSSPPDHTGDAIGEKALIDKRNVIWDNPDIMLAFASAEGFEAWRRLDRGSWFIRSIVYAFSERSRQLHITDLMTEVCNIVSHFKTSNKHIQIAERKDTLSKRFYFIGSSAC